MACDFGIKHYREILETGLKRGYQFAGFDNLASVPRGQKACVIRHDVDYMPEWSIRFGKIENDLGIRATYFFQICAKTYNLREAPIYKTVHELVRLGHTVGLHFDATWKENMDWSEMAEACREDKKVFQAITGIEPCEMISFHNTHRFADRVLNQDIPGMRHAYEKAFFSDIKYISDSQGWYEGCMCKLFDTRKYERFQFLTHPYIWPDKSAGDFISDIARLIQYRCNELTDYFVRFHPVCKKNEARLREELRELQSGKQKGHAPHDKHPV
ncbi:MAG: hypothetical protein PHN49_05120 [Candidatus Omnitrophica bacterium]|nr:hypothetical protein [Candidatus Omnitrophota bacterium]MDD5671001.1 hypothetical protein [Candidatus Omnitrophota bacterium]